MVDLEPIEPWEVPHLRSTLTPEVQELLGSPTMTVGFSKRKLERMTEDHSVDAPYFHRFEELLHEYQYWGRSRRNPSVIELYKKIDDIWFQIVVYPPDQRNPLNSMGTMHRIERRKMRSKIRKYLRVRGEKEV